MQPPAVTVVAILCATFVCGCSKNTQKQRDAAQAAADKYCSCAKDLAAQPAENLAKTTKLCEAEEAAWKTAWKALPDGASNDDKAGAIFNYQSGCYRLLNDAWGVARQAHPQN